MEPSTSEENEEGEPSGESKERRRRRGRVRPKTGGLRRRMASKIDRALDDRPSPISHLFRTLDEEGTPQAPLDEVLRCLGFDTAQIRTLADEALLSIGNVAENFEVYRSVEGSAYGRLFVTHRPYEAPEDERSLYLDNLPRDVSVGRLRAVLREFGTVERIRLPTVRRGSIHGDSTAAPHPRFAFVLFSHPRAVAVACKKISRMNSWLQRRTARRMTRIRRAAEAHAKSCRKPLKSVAKQALVAARRRAKRMRVSASSSAVKKETDDSGASVQASSSSVVVNGMKRSVGIDEPSTSAGEIQLAMADKSSTIIIIKNKRRHSPENLADPPNNKKRKCEISLLGGRKRQRTLDRSDESEPEVKKSKTTDANTEEDHRPGGRRTRHRTRTKISALPPSKRLFYQLLGNAQAMTLPEYKRLRGDYLQLVKRSRPATKRKKRRQRREQ